MGPSRALGMALRSVATLVSYGGSSGLRWSSDTRWGLERERKPSTWVAEHRRGSPGGAHTSNWFMDPPRTRFRNTLNRNSAFSSSEKSSQFSESSPLSSISLRLSEICWRFTRHHGPAVRFSEQILGTAFLELHSEVGYGDELPNQGEDQP